MVYPAAAGGIIILLSILLPVTGTLLVTVPMLAKIIVSIILVAPAGFVMGMCFPAGMRIAGKQGKSDMPWYWALNGVFGVLFSAFAVLISIYSGITTSLLLGAACYFLLLLCLPKMLKQRK